MENTMEFKESKLSEDQMDDLEKFKNFAIAEIEKETAELNRLVDIVTNGIVIKSSNGVLESSSNLTIEELEDLAMKIPAECSRLQSRLNQYSVHNSFKDLEIEASITMNIMELAGTKGTAEERKKKAELGLLRERTENMTYKVIIKGIQGCIDRADKTYEGVKKVIDSRSKEGFFDRKQPTVPRDLR